MNCSSSWKTKPHSHSWYELHYVNSGKAKTKLDNKILNISSGEYYIIPPDTTHEHLPVNNKNGHTGLSFRWQILLENTEDYENNMHFSTFENGLQDKKIRDDENFRENIRHLIKMKKNHNSSLISLLAFMGTIIFDLSKAEKIDSGNNVSNIACSLSYQAKIFLEDNYSQKINMKNLAHILGVSYPYLARVFKKDMGKSLINYLQEIKIGETKKLLGNTSLTLKEIASKVGFNNQYYLSRVFKKHTGMSPGKFRENVEDI